MDGRWNGELVSQGIVLDIGDIEFGYDYLEIGGDAIRHSELIYQQEQDRVRITHATDPSFLAQIRLISDQQARMTIRGVDGYIDLKRNG